MPLTALCVFILERVPGFKWIACDSSYDPNWVP
jgi:hypothetical protein